MSESTDRPAKSGESMSADDAGHASRAANSGRRSLIGPTLVVKGEITAEEDLLVMGRVEGFIDHSQTVIVHEQGTVAAEVKAREVLVRGTVEGNVYGTRRVQIAESGKVRGNVCAPRIAVVEGASFKGAIDMEADAGLIEQRFREATGREAPAREEEDGAKANAARAGRPPVQDPAAAGSAAGDPVAHVGEAGEQVSAHKSNRASVPGR